MRFLCLFRGVAVGSDCTPIRTIGPSGDKPVLELVHGGEGHERHRTPLSRPSAGQMDLPARFYCGMELPGQVDVAGEVLHVHVSVRLH